MTQRYQTNVGTRLSVYAIVQVSALVFFVILVNVSSPGLQHLSQFPVITPRELKASRGQGTSQHAIWADRVQTDDGAIQVAIKYANYEETMWSTPMVLSNAVIPAIPMIPPGYWGPLNWRVVTSLACSSHGSLSAGWITYDSSLSNDMGSAHYLVHDGTTWTPPFPLTNQSNIVYFQLRYSLDGVLYAAWLESNDSHYDAQSWQLYCWQVGSPNSPHLVFTGNESFYYRSRSSPLTLLSGRNGSLYIFCRPRSSILFRYHSNNSWSSIDEFYDDYYDAWDAVIDSQECVHLVYGYYYGDYRTRLQYVSFFNGTWDATRTLAQDVSVNRVWLAVSSIDEVRLLWTHPSHNALYNPEYFIQRYFNRSWSLKTQVVGLPSDHLETQLVLNAGDTYLFQEQPLGSARQFAHYVLGHPRFSVTLGVNITEVRFLGVVASSIPEMLAQFQLYALGVGVLMLVGVIVFLPLVYQLLRSSFKRIFQH